MMKNKNEMQNIEHPQVFLVRYSPAIQAIPLKKFANRPVKKSVTITNSEFLETRTKGVF